MATNNQTMVALQQENAQLQERVAALEMELDETRASYVWLEGMLEQSHLPICYWHGPNQIYQFANSVYRKRAAKPDAVGKPLREVFTEEEVPGLMELVELTYTSGEIQITPAARVWLENVETGERETLWYDLIHNPVRNQQGEVIGVSLIAVDVTEKQRQQHVIDTQQAALREISTPLIPITDTVVIMPLVGTIDSTRAQQVLETLLEGVARHRAELAILDITGVQIVDTQVAQALIQAAQAVKLLGARVMLTGIQPQIAQTLVHLGVDFDTIITRGSLQAGIAEALRQT